MTIMYTKELSKKYHGCIAVENLDIHIKEGQLTAYLGTNGAGKSTTIRMITGTLLPTSGQVYYKDLAVKDINKEDFHIGVVFQDSILDGALTVFENLLIRSQLYKRVTKEELVALMERTGVVKYAQKKYDDLSGGMRRKVDITRALINSPKVLFLDEPTTGLDAQSRQEIWSLLLKLKEEQKLAIFLTTHYLEEAEFADNVYILENGKIIEQGSANKLKNIYGIERLWLKMKNKEYFLATFADKSFIYDIHKGFGVAVKDKDEAIQLLAKHQEQIADFSYKPVNMTEVFLKLTGRNMDNESNN